MVTVTVTFPSLEKRQDVHDAVRGHASVRDEDTTELRCLFRIGQAIGRVENREPATLGNHPMFTDRDPGDPLNEAILDVTIEFDSTEQKEACRQFLAQTNDADLNWLAEQF